jgi:two-component system KDP operon response regulator KdpE
MAAYPTVLIIDDDPMAIQLVAETLRQEDYAVLSAPDGPQGLRAMYEHHPDLIILDVNMPTMDGWTVCQRVREVSNVPIVMLTARDSPDEMIKGLDLGADDYVTKPFDIKVLLARVRATLRRSVADSPVFKKDIIYSDDYLSINLDERRVMVGGKTVRLTPTEFNLLAYLVDNAARVVTYRELLEQIWGFEYIDDIDYLRVYIWHLRRKLEHDPKDPTYIINELGVGYRFEKQI